MLIPLQSPLYFLSPPAPRTFCFSHTEIPDLWQQQCIKRFIMMGPSVYFFGFFLFGIHWASWVYSFMSFFKTRKLAVIISSSIFPVLHSLSSPSRATLYTDIGLFGISPRLRSLKKKNLLFMLFRFCDVSSSWVFLFASPFCYWAQWKVFYFCYCSFRFYNSHFVILYMFYFLAETYLSIYPKSVCP